MATKKTVEASTLDEFISTFNVESIKVNSYYLRDVAIADDDSRPIIISGSSILTKYLPELADDIETVTLSTAEYAKYKYNPKRLSYDVYGTTELWAVILDLNELYSATQFNLTTLRLYKSSAFRKLERIISLNEDITKQNEDELQQTLNSFS